MLGILFKISFCAVLAVVFVQFGFFMAAILHRSAENLVSKLKFSPSEVEFDDHPRLVVTQGHRILSSTQTSTGHYRDITLSVTAFKETFILDLNLNRYLFASNYIEKAITSSGEIHNTVNQLTDHCYYIGRVRDKPGSTVAVNTCKGILGYFAVGNTSYNIEPQTESLIGKHRIYKNQDDGGATHRCGVDSHLMNRSELIHADHRLKRSFRWPQDLPRRTKVVEVYMANDHSQYVARGSDVNNVYTRTKAIVNVASTAFQAVDIYLVLVGIEVWTDRDQITMNWNDSNTTLTNWNTHRMTNINPVHYNDHATLISNIGYEGVIPTLGRALVGGMCSNEYSGPILSDIYNSSWLAGTTLAHEIGHSFGVQHDNDVKGCSCVNPSTNNICVMNTAVSTSIMWSSCSKSALATSFQQGLDICLYNIPQTIFQPSSSTCGNGIVEDGEQCDCGNAPSDECNKSCCNTDTCHLTSSATCAYGKCCDILRCQLMTYGTQCRTKTNDCDIAESCNGVDFLCPADTYQPDGTPCTNSDAAYCYQGQCRSHLSQCQLIWGSGTLASASECYTRLNIDGKQYGNCGLKWLPNVTFIPCQISDTMCGKLQCQDNSKTLSYYQDYYLLSTASVNNSTCHSVIFDFGLSVQDPGLVPNGAKCGEGRICVNQSCVEVGRLATTPCNVSCQQNKICNNVGQCQSTNATTIATTSGATGSEVPLMTIILISVICGSLVLIAVVVTAGIIISKRRKKSSIKQRNDIIPELSTISSTIALTPHEDYSRVSGPNEYETIANHIYDDIIRSQAFQEYVNLNYAGFVIPRPNEYDTIPDHIYEDIIRSQAFEEYMKLTTSKMPTTYEELRR